MSPHLDDLAVQLPAQEFDLTSQELLASLDEELRQIALRLMGYRNHEIAAELISASMALFSQPQGYWVGLFRKCPIRIALS